MNPFLIAAASLLVYCIGIVVYRLYFSPLAKFPGPKIAGRHDTLLDLLWDDIN